MGGTKLSVSILLCEKGFVVFFEIGMFVLLAAVLVVQVRSNEVIQKRLGHIIEGQRLSVVLKIEPSEVKIDPARFEADKGKLTTRLIKALREEKHPQPETQAFMVLKVSGLSEFVNSETRRRLEAGLARLIVNEDWEGAETLLKEVVSQL